MRVWITGLGIVSPLALGARATMRLLMDGQSAFARIGLFEVDGQRSAVAAEVTGVAPPAESDPAWSRTDTMALIAAREALAEAGLTGDPRCDLIVGGTTGGMFETERLLGEMWRDPERREPLRSMLSHPLSATADRLQQALGPFGRARTLCSACSGGANAVLLGGEWIRTGQSARVLVGGADGLCRLTLTGFNALAAMTTEVCRPFDRRRSGLGLGEGAGFLVLESERSARARGAQPLAELAGWGVGCEAHHITHPESSGDTAARLIHGALHSAGLAPGDVDYVNAHGTGTMLNDAMEAAALHRALGGDALRIPVSSVKGQIGHTLGAAGAIEAAVTVLAILQGEVPPTGGLQEPDPVCNLLHVIGRGRQGAVRAALSNSFGFGGSDTVLVFTRAAAGAPRARVPTSPIVICGASTLGPRGLLSAQQSLAYLADGEPPALSIPPELIPSLDPTRARRMDRAARLLTLTMQHALAARAPRVPDAADIQTILADAPVTGAVAGLAYGTVDASAEFIRRMYEKGAHLASPAVFPNLVPSSPVGHAAIYLGLRGPVLATADLAISGESAFATASEWLQSGDQAVMVAASVEERSVLTDRVLGPVCSASDAWTGVRSEGASAVVLTTEAHANGRQIAILARVERVSVRRGAIGEALRELSPPSGCLPRVITARRDAEIERALDASTWRHVARCELAPRTGNHEGLGGFAIVCATGAIAAGAADQVLVVGWAPDRSAVIVLAKP